VYYDLYVTDIAIILFYVQVITSVSYYPQQRGPGMTSTTSTVAVTSAAASNANVGSGSAVDEEDFLTAERMAAWLKENRVLQVRVFFLSFLFLSSRKSIVLKDCLLNGYKRSIDIGQIASHIGPLKLEPFSK
jgi:hypothetical protein